MKKPAGSPERSGICHSYTPDGRCVSLLRILLTNHCIYDCQYCVNRISSDVPRERFTVAEVVELTLEFHRRNYIEGLFLSSGIIKSVDATMEEMVAVARSLRVEHGFSGYIHLKAIPGASKELLLDAGKYADRVSANAELPTQRDLDLVAPDKHLADAERVMSEIKRARDESEDRTFAPAGQTTQILVGATDASDASILDTASRLYDTHALRRVYYTAYSPIPGGDARLPAKPPPLVREHRLYEADWLIRRYGFHASELIEAGPNLALDIDPKLAWALRHREGFPLDVNRAAREQLLRVPGLGLESVKKILAGRRHRQLRLADLAHMGVSLDRARAFLVAVDHAPEARAIDALDLRRRITGKDAQLSLFGAGSEVSGAR